MNVLLGLGAALAISLVGNLWLLNSRDAALKDNGTLTTQLGASREVSQMCSASVTKLEEDAQAAKKASQAAVEAARSESKGKQAKGIATLSKERAVPNDECASIDKLLRDWFEERAVK